MTPMADSLHKFKNTAITYNQYAIGGVCGQHCYAPAAIADHITVWPPDNQVILVLTRQGPILFALSPKGKTKYNYTERYHTLRVC